MSLAMMDECNGMLLGSLEALVPPSYLLGVQSTRGD
jgi:hypothetical protein